MEQIVTVFSGLVLICALLIHSCQNSRSSQFNQAGICETSNDALLVKASVSSRIWCTIRCLSHPLCGDFTFTFGTGKKKCILYSRKISYPLNACKDNQILYYGEAHLGRDIYIGNTAFQINFEKKGWYGAKTHCVSSGIFLYQISNLKDVTDILKTGGDDNFWVLSVKSSNGTVYTNTTNVSASTCGFISGTDWNLQYVNCSIPMAFLCSL